MALRETTSDVNDTPFKWAAMRDAHLQNSINKTLYSEEKIRRAETIKSLLEYCYRGTVYNINYRLTMISIKVTGDIKNKSLLEQCKLIWDDLTVVHTRQGVIYRIPA